MLPSDPFSVQATEANPSNIAEHIGNNSTSNFNSKMTNPTPAIDVRFTNLTHKIHPKPPLFSRILQKPAPAPKTILHSVSGFLPANQSLAILGPSGSGKTTLLNALAGRLPPATLSGDILFAGRPRVDRTKRRIGYVMQEDVFFSKLTVRQTLEFTAEVRVGLPPEDRKKRVDSLISALGLEKCQNVRVGDNMFDKGISGGERKRLNIANELLHDPSLLLADECTSGLDSCSAFAIIKFLKDFCSKGRTVVATIHQPSSQVFALFDNIMLLASGRVAYFGRTAALVQYFERIAFPFPGVAYNPADYVLELIMDDKKPSPSDEKSPPLSVQDTILSEWRINGPKLLTRFESIYRSEIKSKQQQDSECSVIDIDEDEMEDSSGDTSSAAVTRSTASEASIDKPPSTQTDPSPPTSQFARLCRASQKRFWDITSQHGEQGELDKYQTNWFTQVRALASRALRQKQGVLIQPTYLAQAICVTFVTALFWFRIEPREGTIEDRLGAMALSLSNWAYGSTLMAIFTFPLEKKVLIKDRAGGSYRLSAYYFAKSMVEIPADMVYPIAFSTIVYYIIGLNPAFTSYLLFTLTLTLMVVTSQSIGLFISAVVMDIRQAQTLGFVWILSSAVISGYYIDPGNFPEFAQPLRKLSFVKYAYEAMVRTEMLGERTFACATGGEIKTIYSDNGTVCPIDADALLRGAQIEDSLSVGGNIAVLIAWIISIRVLGYFALKWLHTTHKPRTSLRKH